MARGDDALILVLAKNAALPESPVAAVAAALDQGPATAQATPAKRHWWQGGAPAAKVAGTKGGSNK
jgi:hypothetical protein